MDDIASTPGADILVRMHLEDGRDPLVKPSRIVWCARDLYGDGAEMGLRLLDDFEEEPSLSPIADEHPEPEPVAGIIREGRRVQVDSAGSLLPATVIAIGPPDAGGNLVVTMRILEPDAAESEEFDPEQWKARPIRDAVTVVRRYAGPVVRWSAALLAGVMGLVALVARRGWNLVPAGPRNRIAARAGRIAGHRAVLAARRLSMAAAGTMRRMMSKARDRMVAWRNARIAVRAPD